MKTLFLLLWGLLSLSLGASAQEEKPFALSSNDLKGQMTLKHLYKGFGYDGENISPHLAWENAPEGTKSFAITMYDPDAPTGSGWWHWFVCNLPAETLFLPTGASQKPFLAKTALELINDYGERGYGGAAPPHGDKPHAYIITVYALDIEKVPITEDASPALGAFYLNAHALSKASIVLYYASPKKR